MYIPAIAPQWITTNGDAHHRDIVNGQPIGSECKVLKPGAQSQTGPSE